MQGPKDPGDSKELASFEEVKITGSKDDDFVQIGVPMMLVPGGEYYVVIKTKQDADGDGQFEEDEQVLDPVPVKIAVTDGFKAGYNYNVKLTVYGLEHIDIDATLTAWEMEKISRLTRMILILLLLILYPKTYQMNRLLQTF